MYPWTPPWMNPWLYHGSPRAGQRTTRPIGSLGPVITHRAGKYKLPKHLNVYLNLGQARTANTKLQHVPIRTHNCKWPLLTWDLRRDMQFTQVLAQPGSGNMGPVHKVTGRKYKMPKQSRHLFSHALLYSIPPHGCSHGSTHGCNHGCTLGYTRGALDQNKRATRT